MRPYSDRTAKSSPLPAPALHPAWWSAGLAVCLACTSAASAEPDSEGSGGRSSGAASDQGNSDADNSAGASTGSADGTDGTVSGTGSSTGDPEGPEGVPAEPLDADPAQDCPSVYASQAPTSGQNNGFEAAGQTRNFWLSLPEDVRTPRPLVLAFNGTNQTGRDFVESTQLQDFADRGFIVLAPSSNGNGTIWPVWDAMHEANDDDGANPDLAYVDQLLACVAGHYPVDKNRIYVAGHSAGGIMANYVLRRRSHLLAGGIVASGVLSLTGPNDPSELDPMFVLVTWGGDHDQYSGSASSSVSVPQINFVEQASLASSFYEDAPNVGQANCHADLGHRWLASINDWMVDTLLAHPKGFPGADGVDLEAVADGSVSCTAAPFEVVSSIAVICEPSVTDGCQQACQLMGDCAVANGTVGPVLAPQLSDLGFTGTDNEECGGCVEHCEQTATTPIDVDVLSCMSEAHGAAMCGLGIEGAQPVIDAINDCCAGQLESAYCQDVCGTLMTNSVASGFFPTCNAF